MTNEPSKDQRVLINEGTLKKNMNPPPAGVRPPPPKAQVAPPAPPPSDTRKN